MSANKKIITESIDVGHSIEKLTEKSEHFKFTDSCGGVLTEGASSAELDKAVETLGVLFVTIVAHDIGMCDFGEFFHDDDFPLISGILL